jgi:hypothetical protein
MDGERAMTAITLDAHDWISDTVIADIFVSYFGEGRQGDRKKDHIARPEPRTRLGEEAVGARVQRLDRLIWLTRLLSPYGSRGCVVVIKTIEKDHQRTM